MSRGKKLWTLFTSMLYISAFTFGGGFVIVSLMKKRFVDELKWLDEDEMLDLTAIAQASPGAIAVNGAILVGRSVAGIPGVTVSVLGTIIPPLVILSVISLAYEAFAANEWVQVVLRGMLAGAAAVVTDVALGLGMKTVRERDALCLLLMAAAFLMVLFTKVNIVFIILAGGLVGLARAMLARRHPV